MSEVITIKKSEYLDLVNRVQKYEKENKNINNEISLASQDALSEAWLSEEDEKAFSYLNKK